MIAGWSRRGIDGTGVDLVGPLLLLPSGLLLAGLSSLGVVTGVAVALAGGFGFLGVALVRWARLHALPGLVAVVAYAVLVATAASLPIADLLAGISAAALLLALGRSTAAPEHRGRAFGGIALPFLGFLVAFATAIVLPVSRQYVGVAALVAIAAVAGLALLFATPDRPDAVESETS